MRTYRLLWLVALVVVGAAGTVETLLAVRPPEAWSLATAAGVTSGAAWLCYAHTRPVTSSRARVALSCLAGAWGGVVLIGLVALLGSGAVLVPVALGLGHPRIVARSAAVSGRVWRWLTPPGVEPAACETSAAELGGAHRHGGVPTSGRGPQPAERPTWSSKVVTRVPPPSPGWPDAAAVRQLDTAELCWAWRLSFLALDRTDRVREPGRWATLVEVRRRYLDEMARRNAAGFARWLHAGARPASDPARYLVEEQRPELELPTRRMQGRVPPLSPDRHPPAPSARTEETHD